MGEMGVSMCVTRKGGGGLERLPSKPNPQQKFQRNMVCFLFYSYVVLLWRCRKSSGKTLRMEKDLGVSCELPNVFSFVKEVRKLRNGKTNSRLIPLRHLQIITSFVCKTQNPRKLLQKKMKRERRVRNCGLREKLTIRSNLMRWKIVEGT